MQNQRFLKSQAKKQKKKNKQRNKADKIANNIPSFKTSVFEEFYQKCLNQTHEPKETTQKIHMIDNAFKDTIKAKIEMYLKAGTNVTKRTRNLKPRSRVIR